MRFKLGKCLPVVILLILLTACGREKPADGGVTPTGSTETHEGEGVTPTVTVTPTDTPAPTVTPTPTVTVEYGSPEQLRINREMHEVIRPKAESGPLGTGAIPTDLDKADSAYGITRQDPVTLRPVNLATGMPLDWRESWFLKEGMMQTVRVYGLADQSVQERINRRIDEVVTAMANPNFIPEKDGIIAILRERGKPKITVESRGDSFNGILNISVSSYYSWEETLHFATDKEANEFLEAVWAEGRFTGTRDETLQYADGDQPHITKIQYYIAEGAEMLFNLATGDELALSDLFPAEFDYKTYINDAIAAYRYEYYFHPKDHEAAYGREYNPALEYDGAGVFTGIDEKTPFSYYGKGQILYFEDTIGIPLPERVPNPCRGKEVFANPAEFSCAPLEEIVLSEEEYGEYYKGKRFGDVAVSAERVAPKVSVFAGGDGVPCRWTYTCGLWEGEHIRQEIAFPKVDFLAFVKDWAEREWPKIRDYTIWEEDREDFVLREVLLGEMVSYPNGYSRVTMGVSDNAGQSDDTHWYYVFAWMKDGKFIPQEELFDVSYEELLEEILAGLRTENGMNVLTAGEAKETAAFLAGYIKYPTPPRRDISTEWDWEEFEFSFDTYVYSTWGRLPEEVIQGLPKALLNSVYQDLGVHIDFTEADPLVYERHMRIYDGYSFEQ